MPQARLKRGSAIDFFACFARLRHCFASTDCIHRAPRRLERRAEIIHYRFMSQDRLADAIQDFILEHIHTVAQMEALLFLHARPQERWSAPAMAKRLYASEREIMVALTALSRDGFLSQADGTYQFDTSPERAALVDAFAEAYRQHLIPITNLIHSKLRSINAFSDAFKFRKDK